MALKKKKNNHHTRQLSKISIRKISNLKISRNSIRKGAKPKKCVLKRKPNIKVIKKLAKTVSKKNLISKSRPCINKKKINLSRSKSKNIRNRNCTKSKNNKTNSSKIEIVKSKAKKASRRSINLRSKNKKTLVSIPKKKMTSKVIKVAIKPSKAIAQKKLSIKKLQSYYKKNKSQLRIKQNKKPSRVVRKSSPRKSKRLLSQSKGSRKINKSQTKDKNISPSTKKVRIVSNKGIKPTVNTPKKSEKGQLKSILKIRIPTGSSNPPAYKRKSTKSRERNYRETYLATDEHDYPIVKTFQNHIKDQDLKMKVNNYASKSSKSEHSRIQCKRERQKSIQSSMTSISDADYDDIEFKLKSSGLRKGTSSYSNYLSAINQQKKKSRDWAKLCKRASGRLANKTSNSAANTMAVSCSENSPEQSRPGSKMDLFAKFNRSETTRQLLLQPTPRLESTKMTRSSSSVKTPCLLHSGHGDHIHNSSPQQLDHPKPPTKPFVYFAAKQRMLDHRQSGRVGSRPVVSLDNKTLAKRWNAMSNHERKPFADKAKIDRSRYTQHKRIYRRFRNTKR